MREVPAGQRLWKCAMCGRRFANRNQTHTCGLQTLRAHLERVDSEAKRIYRRLERAIRDIGPVTVLPEKTRVAFQVRMSFAAVSLRKRYVIGHLVLARRVDHPRFTRVETYSPRNHLHAFRLDTPDDIDAQFREWLRESYAVGRQEHLNRV